MTTQTTKDFDELRKKVDAKVKAHAEYLEEFGGDARKAYMDVPADHPAYLRLKAKYAAIDAGVME